MERFLSQQTNRGNRQGRSKETKEKQPGWRRLNKRDEGEFFRKGKLDCWARKVRGIGRWVLSEVEADWEL